MTANDPVVRLLQTLRWVHGEEDRRLPGRHMSDTIGTIFVALIGGGIVLITTGPALGAVRSRKAVRELLEIRSALEPRDGAHLTRLDTLLDREVRVLEGLGDTRQRMFKTALSAGSALGIVGGLAGVTSIFIPSPFWKETVLYVSGAGFLLAAAALLCSSSYVIERSSSWQRKVSIASALGAVSLVLLTVAAVTIRDTAYMEQLIGSWTTT